MSAPVRESFSLLYELQKIPMLTTGYGFRYYGKLPASRSGWNKGNLNSNYDIVYSTL